MLATYPNTGLQFLNNNRLLTSHAYPEREGTMSFRRTKEKAISKNLPDGDERVRRQAHPV